MPDLKISGLTAATSIDATDEFVINDTATPGVSGASKRATAAMMADVIKRTVIGDAAYTILPADRLIVTSVAFTAARTWTLPAANAIPAGARVFVLDEIRTITATNTLTIARAGSDTIEGGTASIVLASGGASVALLSDGVSKWSIVAQKRSVNIQVFIGNGTYTPAVGARSAHFKVVGGGGAGGSSLGAASSAGAAGGGASGSYLEKVVDLFSVSTAFTITIGTAGAAAAAGNNPGGAGGATTVAATGMTTLSAAGGPGGLGSGVAAATLLFTAGGAAPAIPTTGDFNVQGVGGGVGMRQSAAIVLGGKGAASPWGDGAPPPAAVVTTAGIAATAFGSGGSGAISVGNTNAAGGAGRIGSVLVTEFF